MGLPPGDFLARYGFRRRRLRGRMCGVWGLDFPFAVPRECGLGGGRQVSTPSGTALVGVLRRLGSGLPPAREFSAC